MKEKRDRDADRRAVAELRQAADLRRARNEAAADFFRNGVEKLAEAERPAADPQVVHMQPKAAADMEDSRSLAWSLYSAAQAEDPALSEFRKGRADAGISDTPWGQTSYSSRGNRRAGQL
jgi:hypothetical protein